MACQDLVCITRPACQPAAPGGWSGLYFVAKDNVDTILYEQVLGLQKGLVSGFTLVPGASLLRVDFENTNTGLVFDSDSASGSNAYAHTVTATLDWKDKESRAAAMLLQSTQVILIAIAKDQGRVMMIGDKREGARLDVNTNANGSLGTDANTRTLTFSLQNDMDQIEMLIPPPSNPAATEDERREYTFDYVQELVNCGTTTGTTDCSPGDESLTVSFDTLSGVESITSTDNGDNTSTASVPLDVTLACCTDPISVQWYDTEAATPAGVGSSVELNGETWTVAYLPDALQITGPTEGNEFDNVIQRYAALFSACGAQSLLFLGNIFGEPTGPALSADFNASFLGEPVINPIQPGVFDLQMPVEITNAGCNDANFTLDSISIGNNPGAGAGQFIIDLDTFPMPAPGSSSTVPISIIVDTSTNVNARLPESIRLNLSSPSCGNFGVEVPLVPCDFNLGKFALTNVDPATPFTQPMTFRPGSVEQITRQFRVESDSCCGSATFAINGLPSGLSSPQNGATVSLAPGSGGLNDLVFDSDGSGIGGDSGFIEVVITPDSGSCPPYTFYIPYQFDA